MKYSDDTDENRKTNIEYINKRWEQLYGLDLDFGGEGIKYLLYVNAGAAVAVLAFHGSVASVRDMVWPKVMLGFFVFGVILIGVLHIARHWAVTSLFAKWQKSVDDYFSDSKGWSEIMSDDRERSKKSLWVAEIAYVCSFCCFVVGAVIGMFNFSTLTSGENHVGKEAVATTSTSTKATSGSPSTVNGQDAGRGAEALSDAKHASPTADPKKEMK